MRKKLTKLKKMEKYTLQNARWKNTVWQNRLRKNRLWENRNLKAVGHGSRQVGTQLSGSQEEREPLASLPTLVGGTPFSKMSCWK